MSVFRSRNGDNDALPERSGVLLRFILSTLMKKITLSVSQWTTVEIIVIGGQHWLVY